VVEPNLPKKSFSVVPTRQNLVLRKNFAPRSLAASTTHSTPPSVSASATSPTTAMEPEALCVRHDIYFLEANKFLNYGIYEKYVKDAEVPVAKKVSKLQAVKNFFAWKKE
jgi:hypothetical protein